MTTYRGTGDLYYGKQRIATVRYHIERRPFSNGIRGASRGTIEVVEGPRRLMGYNSELILQTEDGTQIGLNISNETTGRPTIVTGSGFMKRPDDPNES